MQITDPATPTADPQLTEPYIDWLCLQVQDLLKKGDDDAARDRLRAMTDAEREAVTLKALCWFQL